MISRSIKQSAVAVCMLGFGASLQAAETSVQDAAQLVEHHYYESAAAELRAMSPNGNLPPVAALTLARAYSRNADLYRALQRSSLSVGAAYLKKLQAQRGRERSKYVALYYGEYLAQAGKLRDGAMAYRAFLGEPGIPPAYRDIAIAAQSVAQKSPLPAVHAKDSVAKTQFAAVMSQTAARRKDAESEMDQAIAELSRSGQTVPVRAVTNGIAVYARTGHAGKAWSLLRAANLAQPSYEETISKDKVVRFYDAALLGNLAELDQAEAERLLQHVRETEQFKSVASYFLIELYMNDGQFAAAARLVPGLSAAELPPAYRARLKVMAAALDAHTGKAARATSAFADMSTEFAENPEMLAEALGACVRFQASCSGLAVRARAVAATNQGERYRNLHFAVGQLYLQEGKADRALQEMETARDKSNKNRIDTNDPMLLAKLADLYFAGKTFSEALEIYFEMSKEFPAVRQLQENGEGVYSTEYRSAGDAKIF